MSTMNSMKKVELITAPSARVMEDKLNKFFSSNKNWRMFSIYEEKFMVYAWIEFDEELPCIIS